jgi:hypothetical protein
LSGEIRNITSTFNFILVGNVKIDIVWQIHEQERYESDSSADVDNILKPILDALSGPKGVLIDDCQVQAVSCHWTDWNRDEQQITIRIEMFDSDEWLQKNGIMFVHMGKALCYPIILEENAQWDLESLKRLENMIIKREELLAQGSGYYDAQKCMSCQRVFHISRVQEFEVKQIADLKATLLDKINRNKTY